MSLEKSWSDLQQENLIMADEIIKLGKELKDLKEDEIVLLSGEEIKNWECFARFYDHKEKEQIMLAFPRHIRESPNETQVEMISVMMRVLVKGLMELTDGSLESALKAMVISNISDTKKGPEGP